MLPPPFRIACLISTLAAFLGLTVALNLTEQPWGRISNFYIYTFVRFEPLSLVAITAFFLGILLIHRVGPGKWEGIIRSLGSKRLPLLAAVTVLIFTSLGRFAIHQNFDLCIDEYLNEFEGEILAQHHLVAEVPQPWIAYRTALELSYQIYKGTDAQGYWASGFLPGFAVLDYAFDLLNLGWFFNPLLAALSLGLLASLSRRAFPNESALFANIAVLLLACSPQFLFMAMAKFAWTTHLFGALLWIWLFTHPNRVAFLLTPILGAALIGLHQPHVHVLMAAPFILRLVYTFRWRALLWFGAWYLPGAWAWYQVLVLLRPSVFGQGGEIANLGFPFLLSVCVMICHGITLLSWTTPLLAPLVMISIWTFRRQPALIQDSLLASLFTVLFYFGFPHLQGHGWGYRYMHAVYGCLALAGTGGALILYRNDRAIPLQKIVFVSLLFSLVVQIPYRAYEVRTMVIPMARAWNFIESRPTDYVLVRTVSIWYGADLIRNDPWLKRKPLIFDDSRLTPSQRQTLLQSGSVSVVGPRELAPVGGVLRK